MNSDYISGMREINLINEANLMFKTTQNSISLHKAVTYVMKDIILLKLKSNQTYLCI